MIASTFFAGKLSVGGELFFLAFGTFLSRKEAPAP